ncbi:hypothetical protein HD554DRAFT_2059487 [Boletus coccyginus]|nr:hypothetical protein HD554DRAFT_2059487 [Boletus coccyginus]
MFSRPRHRENATWHPADISREQPAAVLVLLLRMKVLLTPRSKPLRAHPALPGGKVDETDCRESYLYNRKISQPPADILFWSANVT